MSTRPELLLRAEQYCQRNDLRLGSALGAGVHGSVFVAELQTQKKRSAIKVHERQKYYCQERDVYLRLAAAEMTEIRGFAVPELLHHDDELWVLRMTVVTRPFVLDFANTSLDEPLDFSEEVMADWRAEKEEEFGSYWSEVQAVLRMLEGQGIYMMDANPGNISFAD